MIDPARLQGVVKQFYESQPHPRGGGDITVGEYPAFARVAMRLKGSFPDAHDVQAAYHQLKGIGISPGEFEYIWDLARPVANRLLGRDPHILELGRLVHAHPAEIHDYYANLPHPKAPEIRAGDYVRVYHSALPLARQHAQREPNHVEITRFALGGYDGEDMARHYRGR